MVPALACNPKIPLNYFHSRAVTFNHKQNELPQHTKLRNQSHGEISFLRSKMGKFIWPGKVQMVLLLGFIIY